MGFSLVCVLKHRRMEFSRKQRNQFRSGGWVCSVITGTVLVGSNPREIVNSVFVEGSSYKEIWRLQPTYVCFCRPEPTIYVPERTKFPAVVQRMNTEVYPLVDQSVLWPLLLVRSLQ